MLQSLIFYLAGGKEIYINGYNRLVFSLAACGETEAKQVTKYCKDGENIDNNFQLGK